MSYAKRMSEASSTARRRWNTLPAGWCEVPVRRCAEPAVVETDAAEPVTIGYQQIGGEQRFGLWLSHELAEFVGWPVE